MSTQYPGGFITKSPVAPTSSAASGIWTVDQALQYVKAGTWPSPPSPYIEDVFSTYLYTGTSATQTITNSVDLSTKGGLVWLKWRSGSNAFGNALYDTVRGPTEQLVSETAGAQTTQNRVSSFNSNGFTLTSNTETNYLNDLYVSWTFREQAKFFDVVTWTGDGINGRQIPHNLGSVPGCIIVKRTDTTTNWAVYHRSLTSGNVLFLNLTDAETSVAYFPSAPTSTVFSVANSSVTNASGGTYVAYLFAHDAGGYGLSGADNVISCGSFTTDGSGNATVSLGYEPQWVMVKASGSTSPWWIFDNMRGFSQTNVVQLNPNTSNAENNAAGNYVFPTATGFQLANNYTGLTSTAFVYVAIRRGPMKVPTLGTTVFSPVTYTGTGSTQSITNSNFPPDLVMGLNRTSGISISGVTPAFVDRLRGVSATTPQIFSSNTTQETNTTEISALTMTGFSVGAVASGNWNYSGSTYVAEMFRRAPGFFDEVCYTGTGVARTVTHNLAAVPELMIVKYRSSVANWIVYTAAVGNTQWLRLNTSDSLQGPNSTYFNSTTPTSTVFTVGSASETNGGGDTYVAYLFATCAGVSKVGSYTGTAALQTVACGFTSGARFVLIRRTDSTGDWYVWDSARGISSSTDPYLLLNSTAAEVTGTNYVDTDTTGFKVTAAASTTVNISAASYIFLAIA